MTGGPCYNTSICKKLHGNVFEEFIRNAINDRYNIMCSIDAHKKKNPPEHDDGSRSGGDPIPSN